MIFLTFGGNVPVLLTLLMMSRNSTKSYFWSISSIAQLHADFDPPPFTQPFTNCFLTFGGMSSRSLPPPWSSVVVSSVGSVVGGVVVDGVEIDGTEAVDV